MFRSPTLPQWTTPAPTEVLRLEVLDLLLSVTDHFRHVKSIGSREGHPEGGGVAPVVRVLRPRRSTTVEGGREERGRHLVSTRVSSVHPCLSRVPRTGVVLPDERDFSRESRRRLIHTSFLSCDHSPWNRPAAPIRGLDRRCSVSADASRWHLGSLWRPGTNVPFRTHGLVSHENSGLFRETRRRQVLLKVGGSPGR